MEMLWQAMSKTKFWLYFCLNILMRFCRAPAGFYRAEGMIKNVNTIEDYRNMDKAQMILQSGRTVCVQMLWFQELKIHEH